MYNEYNASIPYDKYADVPSICVWLVYLSCFIMKTYFKIVKKMITNI